MSKKVYVVFGECGAYSDYTAWVVAVHSTKDKAEEHAALAQKFSADHNTYDENSNIENPYDPDDDGDYFDSSSYTVLEMPLDWKWPGKNE